MIEVDSRFRGNDRLKTTVSACGLSSLAVNLSHTLFRSENPVFCAVDVRMGRHFMQLSGIEAGKGLCDQLLEPLRDIFGHITIRSAFRSTTVNGYGNEHKLDCASNKSNFARHIWDHRDADGCMGATACIVVPWFLEYPAYRDNEDWRPLAWFIHDKLPYSEMEFYPKYAAFNLTWREKEPRRDIRMCSGWACHAARLGDGYGRRILTKPGFDNHEGNNSEHYRGFPGIPAGDLPQEQVKT